MAEVTAQPSDKSTVIEEGTEFEGKLRSTCALLVRGTIEGEISAPSVSVAPGGRMTGSAKVADLVSQGHISGSFEAEHVVLAGSVGHQTTIRARTLEAKLMSEDERTLEVTFGECSLEVGQDREESASPS